MDPLTAASPLHFSPSAGATIVGIASHARKCAKMKEGIVVGCLLKVVAMASDDEGFTLSVTSKLREFMALGYPSHTLNGAIGRAFAQGDGLKIPHTKIVQGGDTCP